LRRVGSDHPVYAVLDDFPLEPGSVKNAVTPTARLSAKDFYVCPGMVPWALLSGKLQVKRITEVTPSHVLK
jgi:hypothetical protein